MRIVLTGGGTGGHIMPFETIIESLRSVQAQKKHVLPQFIDPETIEIYFVGVVTQEASELFSSYSIPAFHIPSGKIRRYVSALTIVDILFRLPYGILRALWRMWSIMPDVVISKGGYGSIPTVIAAIFYRIPIVLHESDVVPGKTNAFTMRFAAAITLGFSVAREYMSAWKYKLFVTGTPVRIASTSSNRSGAKAKFQIPDSEKVVLIMGGSQGAQQINEAVLALLPELIEKAAVIHIAGPKQFDAVSKVATEILANSPRKELYKVFPYLSDTMVTAFLASDVAIIRAGASTLAEIARFQIPSLIIPLASAANDHQRKNALAFEAAGAALVLDPDNVNPHLLKQSMFRLLSDESLRTTLTENVALLDFPNAAHDIADLAIQIASGFRPAKK